MQRPPAQRPARRSRGEGAIYETADGRVRGSLTLPHPVGTRAVRRYVSGRTRADVARALDELRREAAGRLSSGETTGAYLERWIVTIEAKLRASTHREYARHVARYWSPLASIRLTQLTAAQVEHTMGTMIDRGLSAQTVRHARSTLRRALHDAQRDGLVDQNVAALARPPRLDRPAMRALSPSDVNWLITTTAKDPFGPLYAVAIGTGLRLGEILGLAWSDIDLEARSLIVSRSLSRAHDGAYELAETRTSRGRRTVMLPRIALEALRRQGTRQATARQEAGAAWHDGAGLVFRDDEGRSLRPDVVSRAFREAADRIGLETVRLHDLRHTAATLMLAAGVPLNAVSEALGHASLAITASVYAHVTPDVRREAADAIDRALR